MSIICMLGELAGLQVGNLQGLDVYYLHVGRICRAVGWQPTGFGCLLFACWARTCRAVGWQPTGFGCLLFACWANLRGRRLATYLVWMSIICMLGELAGP